MNEECLTDMLSRKARKSTLFCKKWKIISLSNALFSFRKSPRRSLSLGSFLNTVKREGLCKPHSLGFPDKVLHFQHLMAAQELLVLSDSVWRNNLDWTKQ
ncbi:hypothetical protein RJT34_19791 [Clitoria ternatea]|uniref:Uncharacterized protein n=1 Tax=Clitoria ternatea TaxID=43366 RepID=A0AAN9P520_CLITE